MPIRRSLVLLSAFVIGVFPLRGGHRSTAQEVEKVVQPMLWEIVGEKPSYLFGTIHITDPRCTEMHPLVTKAFESSNTLFVEMAPADQLKQLDALTLKDGSLEELIPEELRGRIDKQLKDINPLFSFRALPPFKVYAWAMVLPNLEAQMRNPTAEILDMKLVTMASSSGKGVFGLEDPTSQLSGMDALSLEEQLAFLTDAIKTMEEADENNEDLEKELANLYLTGDAKAIEEYFEEEMSNGDLDEALVDKLFQALLHDRNERIAETIVRKLRSDPGQTHFFAAGTAHFVGEKSIQEYLKSAGLKVRRVVAEEE